jgi:hypothetical protein
MKKLAISAVTALSLMSLDAGAQARTQTILAFHTMKGVDGPFLGEANAIRGVPGDELPWEIRSVRGELKTSGHLKIIVRGLVFPNDPSVPPELRGKNDETEFRAIVSCLTTDGTSVSTVNVTTPGFPATESGNANIETTVTLPNPCVAPIIFVIAGSEEKWFAVTGFESEGQMPGE